MQLWPCRASSPAGAGQWRGAERVGAGCRRRQACSRSRWAVPPQGAAASLNTPSLAVACCCHLLIAPELFAERDKLPCSFTARNDAQLLFIQADNCHACGQHLQRRLKALMLLVIAGLVHGGQHAAAASVAPLSPLCHQGSSVIVLNQAADVTRAANEDPPFSAAPAVNPPGAGDALNGLQGDCWCPRAAPACQR